MKRVQLAQRRKAVGYSQEKLAELLGVDVSTVRRWECGVREPQPWHRLKLVELLHVTVDELATMLAGTDEMSARANDRLRYGLPYQTSVDLVAVGHLREQIMRLDEQYEYTPASSLLADAGQLYGQTIYLRSLAVPNKVRRELWAAEAESALLTGQLVWDASQRRDHQGPTRYFDRAILAAKQAEDSTVEAYAELRKSYIALYGTGDPRTGLALTERATAASTRSRVVSGLAALHRGEAHAMLGDQKCCDSALGEAEEQFSQLSDDDPAVALFCPTSHGRLAGSCYLRLGQPAKAQPILEATHKQLKEQKKSTAIVLANLSLACICQKNIDMAAAYLNQAIDVLEGTRGGGGLNVAFSAVRELRPWRNEKPVAAVNDRLLTLMSAV